MTNTAKSKYCRLFEIDLRRNAQPCFFFLQIPKTDLFETVEIPDVCQYQNKCLNLKSLGCFLSLIQRRAVTRLDEKHLILMAERRGLFGDINPKKDTGRSPPKTVKKEEKVVLKTPRIKRKKSEDISLLVGAYIAYPMRSMHIQRDLFWFIYWFRLNAYRNRPIRQSAVHTSHENRQPKTKRLCLIQINASTLHDGKRKPHPARWQQNTFDRFGQSKSPMKSKFFYHSFYSGSIHRTWHPFIFAPNVSNYGGMRPWIIWNLPVFRADVIQAWDPAKSFMTSNAIKFYHWN